MKRYTYFTKINLFDRLLFKYNYIKYKELNKEIKEKKSQKRTDAFGAEDIKITNEFKKEKKKEISKE